MKEKKYTLGLDLGITSVGWGIIDQDYKIVDTGVRLFDEALPKADRRIKRSSRRLKRRRSQRLHDCRQLLKAYYVFDESRISESNPYELRVKGLNHKLSNSELTTALTHLMKRRGTALDIEDFDESSADDLSAKKALSKNSSFLEQQQMFVCQHQLNRLSDYNKIRNHENIYSTNDYLEELKKILENQDLPEDLNKALIELIQRKRHYSDGPGNEHSPTPYGRYRYNEHGEIIKVNLIEEMIGKCSVYSDQLRAPKQSWSAELFNFLNDLNNLTIPERIESEPKLTLQEKSLLIDVIKKKGYLKPKNNPAKAIANLLNLNEQSLQGFRIDTKNKPLISSFEGYQKILKAFSEINIDIHVFDDSFYIFIDDLMEMLTKTKSHKEKLSSLYELLEKYPQIKDALSNEDIVKILVISTVEKYHALSFKALREMNIEMLKSSLNQMQLISNRKSHEIIKYLEVDESAILSPVARRVHHEAFKVIQSLQKQYGVFDKVVIETTRDKNSEDQKNNIRKVQDRNKKSKEEALKLIQTEGEHVSNISRIKQLKLRLYNEQNARCAYSNVPVDISALIEDDYRYEIDHIIPYSISLDNSLDNRVLVTRDVNQVKNNLTPYQYFMSGRAIGQITSWEAFVSVVETNPNYSRRKKSNLLNVSATSKYEREGFIERNLVDTSYAIKSFMQTLKNYFETNDIKTKVFTMKGKLTSLFRSRGSYEYLKAYNFKVPNPLEKNRDEFKHHAIDALIVARLSEQGLVKKLLKVHSTRRIDQLTGEIIEDISPLDDQD